MATAAMPPPSRMATSTGLDGSRSWNSHEPMTTRYPVLMTREIGMTMEAWLRWSATWNRHMPIAENASITYRYGDVTAAASSAPREWCPVNTAADSALSATPANP